MSSSKNTVVPDQVRKLLTRSDFPSCFHAFALKVELQDIGRAPRPAHQLDAQLRARFKLLCSSLEFVDVPVGPKVLPLSFNVSLTDR